jgi:hypothetical protein
VLRGVMISMGRTLEKPGPALYSPERLEGLFSEVAVECVAKRRPSRAGV